MIERLQAQKIDVAGDPDLIGLFPGSRSREVRKIFPIMIETARLLLQARPTLRFEVAAASEQLAREMNTATALGQLHDRQRIQIKVGETAEIMQRAWAGIVASGSATLEAAYFRMPFVLVYKVAWPTYVAARVVVNVNYLGMPNVLADREVVLEFIQHRAKPDAIAKAVQPLIEDPRARERMIAEFDATIGKLGGSGASERAARVILGEIETPTQTSNA
jgi:lipid-A-disaccharide synthase